MRPRFRDDKLSYQRYDGSLYSERDVPVPQFTLMETYMSTLDVAKKLADLCRQGKNEEAVSTLFAENAVSVEAVAMPGAPQETKGLAGIKAKGKWWRDNHEVHSASVTGPWPHGDRFVVGFQYDVTNKPSGQRMKMDEVGLFTLENGKIVREEFFYSMGG
jgi:ketosteroid isomerase-like protein